MRSHAHTPHALMHNWSGHAADIRVGLAVFLRIDQCAELYDVRLRVEVESVGFTTEAQGAQRDDPAACEHVEHLGTRGTAFFDVFDGDLLAGLDVQPLGMRFEDVPLRVFDHGWIARILAEPLDELGRIGSAQTLFFYCPARSPG